jgi:hypothetical protein
MRTATHTTQARERGPGIGAARRGRGGARAEALALERLKDLTGRVEDPLSFLVRALASRPLSSGSDIWSVPSGSVNDLYYEVDISVFARTCTCDHWHYRHTCSHLRICDLAARLRYSFLQVRS